MNPNNGLLLLFCSVAVASFSQILLKTSARRPHADFWAEYCNPYVIAGYGMLLVSTVLTVLAYRTVDFKNGPIVESLGYLLVMVLSRLFFGEPLTRRKLLGNALILAGVAVFYL
jgi:small multidrug resistance pump